MHAAAVNRVRVVFDLFDADGNGVLEPVDFELMADRVVAAAPHSAAADHQALRAAFHRYWTTLADVLDTNGDGRIDFDEYTACVLSPERFEATIDEFAEALAALGDPEGLGTVGRADFMALMLAIGFEEERIDALFDAFEPSADDRIGVDTWAVGIRDYYAPDKAGIPGDHLAGGVAA
ncbi:EF-hand domain-containing protein [Streptomyces sp. DSM 44915]|uniref:EF-hand domain-containing protein n=1 Tax=Streptomyces chisholmiae TaxID=3075540 RepID=A0ABU2JSB2_9ACTN|nr:EF-hand domain-containing protein [Streptomyces sp. DSM 44915]MDT0267885.1 EF-hand domain-containing protein [Streptomyces sp. DSM 44915]